MRRLEPPYALVTGASRGIGKSIVQYLLNEEIKVAGTARKSSFPAEFTKDPYFEGMHVDLNSREQVDGQIRSLFDKEQTPNIIVNNAGISEDASYDESDEAWLNIWDKTMQINLKMPALICKWALNRWTNDERGIPGIIINVSSRAGYRGDTSEFSAYAASKGGMAALTKSIARNYGSHGITAYTIAPGFVNTDMAHQVKNVYGSEYLKKDLVLEELTPPEQIAEIVLFLAQGNARHMTGNTFHVNAGSYMV